MKKMILSLVVIAGFLFLGTNVASAVEDTQPQKQTTEKTCPNFVDSNNDGVCDLYDGTRPGKGQGNGQGAGQCTGLKDGSRKGQGKMDGSGAGRNKGNGRQDGSGGNCTNPPKK